jgi:epoxyqueuosine reductase
MMKTMGTLETALKQQARTLGFDKAGIAPAVEADGFDWLRRWLDQGHAGEMEYMHRHADARRHPASVLPAVRSVVMLAMSYKPASEPAEPGPLHGKVARYARGADYHDVLRERLNQLGGWLEGERPGCAWRGVVDTAPLLERDFARRAGLGWFGKNTMLLDRRLGSYFFLGALLTDLDLQADPPYATAHCGTCTACLDACPTDAFVAPYALDSRRCISYLTIELRGPVPEELRSELDGWVFGCDVCQEVCPWNRKALPGSELLLQGHPNLVALDLIELFGLDETAFRERFRDTALWRTKRRGLLRNAALVLGAQGTPEALDALQAAGLDPDPLVSAAAVWAAERICERYGISRVPTGE